MTLQASTLDEHRLRRLIEVGRGLVSVLDVEVVLQRVLEEARELTSARYAALGILDEQRCRLERFLTVGMDAETHAAIGDLPRGRGILGELIREPTPLRLHDVNDHPRSYGFPPGHPRMHSFLGVPILIRGEAFGNLYLTDKADGDFDAADEEAVMVLADWAGVAIHNGRLYRGVEVHRDELERAVRGLEATTDIARAVGGEPQVERVLELIAKRARALVEARSVVIALREGDELVVGETAGEVPPTLRGVRVPIVGSLGGHVLRSGRAQRLEEAAPRSPLGLAEHGLEAAAGLLVPLAYRGRAVGVLGAFDRLQGGPRFGDEDERLLASFAVSAATAVATARSVAAERLQQSIAAAEHERRRWARELHDETLQGLGAVRFMLDTALQGEGGAQLEAAVRDAARQVGDEIRNLRGLITELRPAALDELGVRAALASLVERVADTEGLSIEGRFELGANPSTRYRPELETTVYRLVQEALTNMVKHANACHAVVELQERDGSLEVSVEDDGLGFDPSAAHHGFGLLGMHERVALVGGGMSISSRPGGGTAIRATLPVEPPGAGVHSRSGP